MKLNIYFKNVGQGDTILLDWYGEDPQQKKYALIDCNLIDRGIEPIRRHIENAGIREFEFVVMSHPHWDHFSGFRLFLKYCEEKSIGIGRFYHTASYDPSLIATMLSMKTGRSKKQIFEDLITFSVHKKDHKIELKKLYAQIARMHEERKTLREGVFIVNNDSIIPIGNELAIRFLAPYSSDEIRKYVEGTHDLEDPSDPAVLHMSSNNPKANFLSSVLQIFNEQGNWQVILSSDCTEFTLRRILRRPEQLAFIKPKKLLAAQVPHHGSDYNHVREFWDTVQDSKETPVFISVGEGYGLPDVSVVAYFAGKYNSVHATNLTGGYAEYYDAPGKKTWKDREAKSVLRLLGSSVRRNQGSKLPGSNHPKCGEKHVEICFAAGELLNCQVWDVE